METAQTKTGLRELRIQRGLTQEQLAEMVGCASYVSIGQWERGQIKPSGPARKQLALALGVSDEEMAEILAASQERGAA